MVSPNQTNAEPAFFSADNSGTVKNEIISGKLSDVGLTRATRQLDFYHSLGISGEQLLECAKTIVSNRKIEGFQVPKVRYGSTEIQMPIVTTGLMRIQYTWFPDNLPISINRQITLKTDAHKNLYSVVKRSLELGMNHFETARMYGTSEYQIVDVLNEMIKVGEIKREDFIFQTKIVPSKLDQFQKDWETTWENVKCLGCIDLFSLHVIGKKSDFALVMESGIIEFVKNLKEEGKIKHIGFSTHGTADMIMKLIDTKEFEFINIHCHYFGSYHGSGTPDGKGGTGNTACVKRALELDMGVFLISPYDKGGLLYRPTKKVASTISGTNEENPAALTPMQFASLYAWQEMGIHTISVGFAFEEDFDEPLKAAKLYASGNKSLMTNAKNALDAVFVEKLGSEWAEKGLVNIPSQQEEVTGGIAIGHILWLHNVVTAYGMYDYAKDRYSNLESAYASYSKKKSISENIEAMSRGNLGYCYHDDFDLTEALKDHYDPPLALQKVKEAHGWLCGASKVTDKEKEERGWDLAYNLTVWTDFHGVSEANISSSVMLRVLKQNIFWGKFGSSGGPTSAGLKKASELRALYASA